MARTPAHSPQYCSQFAGHRRAQERASIAFKGHHTMGNENRNAAIAVLFPMIGEQLKRASSIATAAATCASNGDVDAAFHILLDSEGPARDAMTLLNAACLLHREN
jgi:hypothetical protein